MGAGWGLLPPGSPSSSVDADGGAARGPNQVPRAANGRPPDGGHTTMPHGGDALGSLERQALCLVSSAPRGLREPQRHLQANPSGPQWHRSRARVRVLQLL